MPDGHPHSHAIQMDDPLDSNSTDTASISTVTTAGHGAVVPALILANITSASPTLIDTISPGSAVISPRTTLPTTANNTHGNTGLSSGFALPTANPFTERGEPVNPFSPAGTPQETPMVTPLGSPTQELQKLSLGVERYARAIEDPGPMGSFSGTVPLPSLSQADHYASRRRPSRILLDAIVSSSPSTGKAAECSGVNNSSQEGGSVESPTGKSSKGLNLNTIKRALSGRRRMQDATMVDLETNHTGDSSNTSNNRDGRKNSVMINDLGNPFSSPMLSANSDAQVALLNSLSFSPQPLLLPSTLSNHPLQEAANESRPNENDEIRRRLEQSNSQVTATATVDRSSPDMQADSTAATGMRHRKPKGGILSQLLKLQRNEAAAAAAASGSSGARKPHGSPQHPQNNSFTDLNSPSATTTRLDSSNASTTTTRLPTQPPTSINNASSPFNRPDPHEHIEEMEAISAAATAAATAATLSTSLGIQRDIAEILTRQSFLIMIAKALILYGAPSHRIEETCALLARKMDVDASFALLPGLMTISFSDPETHTSDTRHLRCTQGMDMYKLSKVYTIAWGVLHGEGIEEANKKLEKVTIEPGYYPVWVTVMSWMFAAAFVAPLAFNGSWLDTVLAGFCVVAAKFPVYGNVFEVTSSILVGFIAKAFGDRVCFSAVALAGVVVLLPGLLLTQSIMELASRNIVSGAVRMFYALMYAFFLGFGLSLGAEIWDSIGGESTAPASACEKGVNHWWLFLIFPAVSTSINIVFNAHPSQWLGMTVVTAVGFTVSYFMTAGPQVTPAVAAFAVGVAGQAYGRITGKLSYVPLLSGVLLLVPGSVGVRGVLAIIGSDPGQGFQFALRMVNISVSITLGVFCSALVWYPFWRKSTFMNF
ncbi:hypothetical protein BC939DRAFT_434710 [Gamsiella multidivaricata]|uniref:uncharacterized protein n=1 Tax=Gamsiella multidivaricata TaxID=101098 RepID=UPI002220C100|nr:uncharacterized protein BC939DRAFT_465410 [Gamsiella multidivaricata]XP_051418010.1 uncharacterized protein BC939DRAFT_434710 [Gamsiella multidivaricata]KAI7817639.1 hypothetical protein BC939DRAFT_465410 [Gamsiella multidivaricata]KAI7832869.1 hypothetical protein BC939DRAFT_434710 [Gamsiella multidivaricata]